MPGKIFPESASIYDDQARILFDYYKRLRFTLLNRRSTGKADCCRQGGEGSVQL